MLLSKSAAEMLCEYTLASSPSRYTVIVNLSFPVVPTVPTEPTAEAVVDVDLVVLERTVEYVPVPVRTLLDLEVGA